MLLLSLKDECLSCRHCTLEGDVVNWIDRSQKNVHQHQAILRLWPGNLHIAVSISAFKYEQLDHLVEDQEA